MKDVTLSELIRVHGTIYEVVTIDVNPVVKTCVLGLRIARRIIRAKPLPKHLDNGNDPIIN